ncbi:MAG: 4-hydroxy-3-methylbut-2-enyl diphosphate reductase [Verrucomicrobiota bacterium]|nr:4-hydroxy-3-methylbut-2-enyl diphosphate reductase [Verrucomicrobiota bacterium]
MQVTESSTPKKKVNLRTPDVMDAVKAQVETHYRSETVDRLRQSGRPLTAVGLTIKLAKQFGFCYGVERAIDLAYAARKVFKDQPIYILGEIIHNPEVNEQLESMGLRFLSGKNKNADIDDLKENDVVIIPAFGAEVKVMNELRAKGVQFVDTTCGDVMSVWKRVRQYANEAVTSIIHGKAWHEETQATSSRATENGRGHYLVVYTLDETDYVCNYIRNGGDREAFLEKFKGAYSQGFDPDQHLTAIGVANQTTMMRNETEDVQRRIKQAITDKYGTEKISDHFRFFDTICGATQERQDALTEMLKDPLDMLLVIGGYNSSNTSHLAEMGQVILPTYFIRNSKKIISSEKIIHFDLHQNKEVETDNWLPKRDIIVGITAGASCPNNLIEETIHRLAELRGIKVEELLPA